MPRALESSEEDATTWHALGVDAVLAKLQSRREGLSDAEVRARLVQYGPNELVDEGGRTIGQIVWEQVSSTMILILVVAGVLALFFKSGDGFPVDAIAIFAIVVLFVVLGVLQEHRAQKAIAALKQMSAPTVRAVRGGRVQEVSSRELVPGDLVKLETGSVVPADCRIVESVNLRIQEAALTGESEPIEKDSDTLPEAELPLGDRRNMGYQGTFASYGRGAAVVVATGMRTELGRIATLIQGVPHDSTPLQRKLDGLGKLIALVAVVVAALVALIGIVFEGKPVQEVLILGISIAVAIVPEGLPAVLTFTLALGAQRMLGRKALIRKLPAVETLGSVTVICSDKTGTLTQNKMTVTFLETLDATLDVEPLQALPDRAERRDGVASLLAASSLCCDATFDPQSRSGIGDPTEIALVAASLRFGLAKEWLEAAAPRVHEFAFDSDRKLMTTVHRVPEENLPDGLQPLAGSRFVALTKGAADHLLRSSSQALLGGEVVPLNEALRGRIADSNRRMAGNGMRVLGVGCKRLDARPESLDPSTVERDLVFVGLVGMIDPPRPEVLDAVARCGTAGIRTIMITGDHPDTARFIAADLGIAQPDSRVVTGLELDKMSDADLRAVVGGVNVFARVSPEHKLRIVTALQENGEIVAMTGDGVNDAPALKKADIGVAMGITGTDVSKEAADMVLLDDNFATIVNAVEEGRVVFDNLRRFITFSIAGNIGKVAIVAVPPLIGMAAMLRPVQILFSNLLTDGLMGLGMGVEQAERNTMQRPPYRPSEPVLSGPFGAQVAFIGLAIAGILIGFGAWQWTAMGIPALEGTARDGALLSWGTLMFTTLALMQILRSLAARSFREPFWKVPLRGNKVLMGMLATVLALQLLAVYLPGVQTFFWTVPLTLAQVGHAIGMAVLLLAVIELYKRVTLSKFSASGPDRQPRELGAAAAAPGSAPASPSR